MSLMCDFLPYHLSAHSVSPVKYKCTFFDNKIIFGAQLAKLPYIVLLLVTPVWNEGGVHGTCARHNVAPANEVHQGVI
jgi:hypothetical protein